MKVAKDNTGKYFSIEDAVPSDQYFCLCSGNEVTNKNHKKIRKRVIHFAHKGECTGNLETYLHYVAKYIISINREIYLPKLGKVKYSYSEIEIPRNDIKPDAILVPEKHDEIAIEIFVTNKKDQFHIDNYKQNNFNAFEIDLRDLDDFSDFRVIRERVITDIEHKKVLHINGNNTQPLNKKIEWYEDPIKLFGVFLIGLLVWLRIRKK